MLKPDASASSGKEKWGDAAMSAGFSVIPNHLIAINQFVPADKQLTPTEVVVLLQILVTWWSASRLPFPSKATIAARAGLSPRQVQRALAGMEEKGYIRRIQRIASNLARTSNEYNLDGLQQTIAEISAKHPSAFKRATAA